MLLGQDIGLELGLYRFSMEIEEPMELPEFKGGAIRGGFGTTFKRLTCYLRGLETSGVNANCTECAFGDKCPYKIVFEPSPPKGAKRLRNLQDIPRPFVIRAPSDARTILMPGDHLEWEVVLAGNVISFLPYFVVTFKVLGEDGFGLWRKGRRSKAKLDEVLSVNPFTHESIVVYDGTENMFAGEGHHIVTGGAIDEELGKARGDSITLNFVSMTRLKYKDAFVKVPEFHVLVRNLLRRVSTITYFYQGIEMETDFRDQIERAEQVSHDNLSIQWKEWIRYSGRSKRTMDFSGFVGKIRYRGDLRQFLPLLLYGSFLNVGKNAAFGLGQYEVEW